MTDVFVSYSRPDAAHVESIVHRLSGRGYGVWWDRGIRGGEDFGAVIQSALLASTCAVVAWSKASRHSLWVRAAANSARESGKLVQVTLDGTKPPTPFGMLHALDFKQDDGSPGAPPMQELLASVASVISGEQLGASAAPAAPQKSLAGFGSVAAVGGASICLVVLASALAGLGPRALSAEGFGLASSAMFLAAVLAFAFMLVRVILTYLASRQR
jgi:hypothetical protein